MTSQYGTRYASLSTLLALCSLLAMFSCSSDESSAPLDASTERSAQLDVRKDHNEPSDSQGREGEQSADTAPPPLTELVGYTPCSDPYAEHCHPVISSVESKLKALGSQNGIDVNRDSFSWESGYYAPGYFTPEDIDKHNKTHLQSIQTFEALYPGEETSRRYLAVTMGDEYTRCPDTQPGGDGGSGGSSLEPCHYASINLVWTPGFGSEEGELDRIVAQKLIVDDAEVAAYNHPGGTQLIGDYLFVALEDMKDHSRPKTGVWKLDRAIEFGKPNPSVSYQYSVDVAKEYVSNGGDGGALFDHHHSATGVTKLQDGTYLLAACVESYCEAIRFFKSTHSSLGSDPDFRLVDEWRLDDPGNEPIANQWTQCGHNSMNLVVQDDGAIFVVLFAGEKTALGCSTGGGDDYLYLYKLGVGDDSQIGLEFKGRVRIGTGDKCDPLKINPASGTNFDAGSGLWIGPDGKDDIAVLATEHYDSCIPLSNYIAPVNPLDPLGPTVAAAGTSRWGVTSNWSGASADVETACFTGYADCDQDPGGSCEINTKIDRNNCGTCGKKCASDQVCNNGECKPSADTLCFIGHANCNLDNADGCEIDIRTDKNNCGACGNFCAVGQTCSAGSCL